jgi:Bacterial Ig domain
MRCTIFKSVLNKSGLAAAVLLLGSGASFAQSVNLTAKSALVTLPDGTSVPMWGLFCNDAGTAPASCAVLKNPSTSTPPTEASSWATGTTYALGTTLYDGTNVAVVTAATGVSGATAPVFAATPATATIDGGITWTTFGTLAQYQAAYSTSWAPPVIRVSPGPLTIKLTNALSFTPSGSSTPNTVPTSLVIVGQLGGGLGATPNRTPSPTHAAQSVTWATVGNSTGAQFNPPTQPDRVQSFGTEVGSGATTALTWSALQPGTYLIESGTHPSIQGPMGLYGILVVTTAPVAGTSAGGTTTGGTAGCAYPGTGGACLAPYDADVPILLSEIDPVQNSGVARAVNTVGFSETAIIALKDSLSGVILSTGSGYQVGDVVTFTGGGLSATTGVAAQAQVASVDIAGAITGVNVTNAGSGYASAPTATVAKQGTPLHGSGTASLVVAFSSGSVTAVAVSGGAHYAVGDSVTISNGGGLNAAATVASVDSPATGVITGFNVTNAGAGYTSVPGAKLASATGSGAQVTAVLSLAGDLCGNGTAACYPPAVNYTPMYYLMNGVAFDKTNATASLFGAAPAIPAVPLTGTATGNVLARFVNAGLRMHVPAIVGSQVTSGAATPTGFALIAEDGNPLPGIPRVQSEVFMAAGKTYDVMINAPATVAGATAPPALPVYDRQLSLSGNAISRDAGMLAYIGVNGGGVAAALPAAPAFSSAIARADTFNSLLPCPATATAPCTGVTISDPAKGLIANDTNVYGVQVKTPPTGGTLTLNANGTFTYVPNAGTTSDSFTYMANGNPNITATVTLGACATGTCLEAASGITLSNVTYNSNVATYFSLPPPGILAVDTDSKGYPLSVVTSSVVPSAGLTLTVNPNGSFNASVPGPGTYTFNYQAQNSQGTVGSSTATVTLVFPQGSGLTVNVVDPVTNQAVTDYRWIIEEDKTFYVNPATQVNTGGIVPDFGTNFHTSDMPFVAQGCTGQMSCEGGQTVYDPTSGAHVPAVCDLGNGACRPDPTGNGHAPVMPSQVNLDPTKRYYISVLPGDAATPFTAAYSNVPCSTPGAPLNCVTGHGMGGTSINFPGANASAKVIVQPSPYPPGDLSVFVFEDDFPLNGEVDSGGGLDVLAPNEPGLGGFQIHLWDAMGGNGDFTGQMTYDMFNQPLTNGLDGNIDPVTGFDACPITKLGLTAAQGTSGITGMIVTCPKYEYDPSGKSQILSALAGQAVVKNLMPGRWGVIATPAADRIARGEEWHQTNTLDGQKAHDSFVRIGEPEYFQEYGPANFHVTIGFANPAIINARKAGICAGTDPNLSLPPGTACNNSITGKITTERMSRTPDERLYSSGSHDSFYWTQCYVSFGDPDGEDFAFTKCNADGTFSLTGLPSGTWRVTVFDQWNDMLVDGLSTPVALGNGATVNMGDIATNQWQANIYTRTFIDDNKDGVSQSNETGIPFNQVNVRYRDGSLANNLVTDFTGTANFNEEFPLFNWYVVESDVTRYKNTGTHSVYDAGGPADGTGQCNTLGTNGYPPCGASTIGNFLANTAETVSVPKNLRVPGAVYCANADCSGSSIQNPSSSAPPTDPTNCVIQGTSNSSNGVTSYNPTCTSAPLSTGRIDPPWLAGTEGYQGFSGENNFLEFGKEPYNPGENGGIKGHVVYASTRPFDDPQMLVQVQWEPLVAHVTMNLYQEGTAADGTTSLTLVDTTQTSSWDDWAQGFHLAADGVTQIPNMSCPGQTTQDLFYFTLQNQPNYLNVYAAAHGGPAVPTVPYQSQFKCYDGLHMFNQLQPAPYDGMYAFPSVTATDPTTGKPTATNCKICTPNTAANPGDLYLGLPQLPPGKYVVEVVLPAGYELVKEEDKNILIGDDFIAPVTQQFGALGNIFIIPDQASISNPGPGFPAGAGGTNANNPQNPTNSFGVTPEQGFLVGFSPEPNWPCVGQARIVPDYISLFPQSKQVAPFAGATRPLCDRKEVVLTDQSSSIAKFYIYTSTHRASKYTGVITDDFTSEFDPFSPQFGEKFSPPNMPVSIKDWTGAETSRVYSDQWGTYNGMTYSTWEVNPPNPTGYSPTMMVFCMNDPGSGATPDPLFNPLYSQFCYELPFMPAQTQYLDTPVVPTAAYVGAGYNNPDCAYPDATPAISEVDSGTPAAPNGTGPYVSAAGQPLTIFALGNESVINNGYTGPSATTAPYNQKTVTRHYGFGGTPGTVTIGGKTAAVTSWSDTIIAVTAPTGVANCAVQQQAQYQGTLPAGTSATAQCGQLVITAANGKQSIDAVTVTIGGKPPTYVTSTAPLTQYAVGAVQQAIDAAAPGDLIMLPAGVYNEMLVMWKPVRLQGVGAASTVINANTQPAGKLDPWRAEIGCLFGLGRNGVPIGSGNAFDATNTFSCPGKGYKYFSGTFSGSGANAVQNPQVDRLPLEGIVGWDTTTNGNLAQLLQEPTLMGAYEGAAITVLSKGVNTHGLPGYYGSGNEATFPTGSTVLTSSVADCGRGSPGRNYVSNPNPSNFQCNPSSIDGLSVTDSSQGGGGVFVHAWAHNLQIANNRVYNNIGTLSGGINIGQGESPDAYVSGTVADSDPGSCQTSGTAGLQLPYCFDLNVNVHNNMVTANTSIGDELFSGTPAGAGGVSFCTGADYYQFNYNWVCGNMSTGDGGGLAHVGFSYNGDIEHNWILFNQSTNPTIATNGGGIVVMGAAPDGLTASGIECGSTVADLDCAPGLPDGTGPNLVINANLILGNSAASGSGGGLRLQSVNGTEIAAWPKNPGNWNSVKVTNNIIVNNVAGWDGGGISLQDALKVDIVNNTIASNDTTASSGVLFNTLGAPLASAPGATNQTTSPSTSAPQPAGLVSMQNSANLTSTFVTAGGQPLQITCPVNHPNCAQFSNPYLANDLFWQNRAFYIGVGALSAGYQQNIITMFNAAFNSNGIAQTNGTAVVSQPGGAASTANGAGVVITGGTGACMTNSTYWDIGVRGDSGPGNHNNATWVLSPTYSALTNASENTGTTYATTNLVATNPDLSSQYCNGSRTPPEAGGFAGWQVPPGISDATVPNPVFNLSPAATVDEGNNWVNISWGPLALTNPVTGSTLGNYAPAAGSPVIDVIPPLSGAGLAAPNTDFFGNPRPDTRGSRIDIGAVEYQQPPGPAVAAVTGGPVAFGNVVVGSNSAAHTLTLNNTGGSTMTGVTVVVTVPFTRTGGTCAATLAAGASCTITLEFSPTAAGASTGTATITGNVAVTGSPVALSGTGVAAVVSASLTPATWSPAHTRNCPGTGLGALACALDPAQAFTLTNTGNVTLTGIAQGALGGVNASEYAIARMLSNCGPAGGGQFGGDVTLAPGATCTVTVQFKPLTAQPTGIKNATISVTDLAGTQTSTLSGTAQ